MHVLRIVFFCALLGLAQPYYQPISQVRVALPHLSYATSHAPFDLSHGSIAGLFVNMRAAVVNSLGVRFVPPDFTLLNRKSHDRRMHCTETSAGLCSSLGDPDAPVATLELAFPAADVVRVQDPSTNGSFPKKLHWSAVAAAGCESVDGSYRKRAIVHREAGAPPRYDLSACDVTSNDWTIVFDPVDRTISIHPNALPQWLYVILCVSATLSAAAIIKMVSSRRRGLTAASPDSVHSDRTKQAARAAASVASQQTSAEIAVNALQDSEKDRQIAKWTDGLATTNCVFALAVCVVTELQSPNTFTLEDSCAFWYLVTLNTLYAVLTALQLYYGVAEYSSDPLERIQNMFSALINDKRQSVYLGAPVLPSADSRLEAALNLGLTSKSAVDASYSTTLDMLIASVSVTMIRIYGNLEHPYNGAIAVMLAIRILDRILVVLSGIVSLERFTVPDLAQRLAAIYLDTVALGVMVQFGLAQSFIFKTNLYFFLFPMFYATLTVAKALRHLVL